MNSSGFGRASDNYVRSETEQLIYIPVKRQTAVQNTGNRRAKARLWCAVWPIEDQRGAS